MQRWGASENFLGQLTYSTANAAHLLISSFQPWKSPSEIYHLNGEWATPNARMDAFANVATQIVTGGLGSGVKTGLGVAKVAGPMAKAGAQQGFKSLGAAGRGFSKVLQSGGQSLNPSTLKALNLTKEQGRNAMHALKGEKGLGNNFHGKIMGNGDYLHPSTGEWLGNLFDYL